MRSVETPVTSGSGTGSTCISPLPALPAGRGLFPAPATQGMHL
jgi:hypothetical protein